LKRFKTEIYKLDQRLDDIINEIDCNKDPELSYSDNDNNDVHYDGDTVSTDRDNDVNYDDSDSESNVKFDKISNDRFLNKLRLNIEKIERNMDDFIKEKKLKK